METHRALWRSSGKASGVRGNSAHAAAVGRSACTAGANIQRVPLYVEKTAYSRYLHSLGAAAIVWHFTKDEAQSLSALFHDIATPVFAHVVDFLNGDHLAQESTEAPTHDILTNDAKLQAGLRALGLQTQDVDDYHRYPIADNDSPRLSSDRLEYTLGNAYRVFGASLDEISAVYENLTVLEFGARAARSSRSGTWPPRRSFPSGPCSSRIGS